jgi:hypothetical protein
MSGFVLGMPIAILVPEWSTDMVINEFYTNGPDAHPFVKPWVVVTKSGVVVNRFEWSQSEAAHVCARQLASGFDSTVRLYVVDSQVIPSPTIGDVIDSEIGGWVLIQ